MDNQLSTPAPPPSDDEANPVAVAGDSPLVPPPMPQASAMMQHFGGRLEQAQAQYQRMKESQARLVAVRKELDRLVALGDTATSEDLVKAGSGLVACGLQAVAIATLLADAPDSGPELQTWIEQHDAASRQREAQNAQALAVTRHELGSAALRTLMGHGAEQAGQAGQAGSPPAPAGNDMSMEAPNAG